mmetsp:Transcript_9876/g.12223  ORF Transcript_9876/g.12223 Transcript_9876/m.12223 type:complete len:317 (-) Transcript_9876:130-1080(-)|eukprot:CAMPEP_0172488260 /NCGR_PEP_ID=MMETSP1066-20121228/17707_1 /TAXON_ID=671091 /ORGANISM="Coscinodiscus wailesii, Strain CCMP2513" /LENGTH=316 /DNA_ID=CAMNT_0013255375 /DNA_START=51 /DNA_END=1001 /DNA_ORIENTATION=+
MITSFFSPKSKKPSTSKRGRVVPPNDDTRDGDANNNNTILTPATKRQKAKVTSQLTTPKTKTTTTTCREVDELLRHINDNEDDSWRAALSRYTSSSQFASLAKFVSSERSSKTVYPPAEDTFSALNLTPLRDVKVVVVGQDPYHGPGQGHGLAFSVRKSVPPPPSLKNIYKELANDAGLTRPFVLPKHGFLERWARQGVVLLNATLTVRRGEANSHAKKGWEGFTDEIIRVLDRRHDKLVFLLWGKPASKKALTVINRSKHVVICTSHPSPLGASKTSSPFLGSRCFSKANEALKGMGKGEIDWNVDGALDEEESG